MWVLEDLYTCEIKDAFFPIVRLKSPIRVELQQHKFSNAARAAFDCILHAAAELPSGWLFSASWLLGAVTET